MHIHAYTYLHHITGVFHHKQFNVVVIAYVDDCVFAGKNKSNVLKLKIQFMKIWECRDLGEAKEFLKMRIQQVGRKLILDQQDYLKKIVT